MWVSRVAERIVPAVKGSNGVDSGYRVFRCKGWFSRALWVLLVVIGLPVVASAQAVVSVRVGVYDFPPFAEIDGQGQVSGLVTDLLAALNQSQHRYHFVIRQTSPKRRYQDFKHHHFDLILFENPDWGWQSVPHLRTRLLMQGREVYIAYRLPGRTQHFFDNLEDKRLLGILGYHYGFAGFHANEHYLHQHFQITLTDDLTRNVRVILANRPDLAQIAVVPHGFLNLFERRHPGVAQRLLVCKRVDQTYRLYGLVQADGPISATTFDQLLQPLEAAGTVARLQRRYGLPVVQWGQHQRSNTSALSGNQAQRSAAPAHP